MFGPYFNKIVRFGLVCDLYFANRIKPHYALTLRIQMIFTSSHLGFQSQLYQSSHNRITSSSLDIFCLFFSTLYSLIFFLFHFLILMLLVSLPISFLPHLFFSNFSFILLFHFNIFDIVLCYCFTFIISLLSNMIFTY